MERIKRQDPWLLILGLVITLAGWLFIFDAGYARSISSNQGIIPKEFTNQVAFTLISLFFYVACSLTSPSFARKVAGPLWGVTLVSLAAVLAIGHEQNGAKRWISLGSISIQPSEFAKLALVLYFAAVFASRPPENGKKKRHWTATVDRWMPAVAAVAGVALIEFGKDLGTAAVVGSIAFLMAYLGGAKPKSLGYSFLAAVVLVGVLLVKQPYRMTRIVNHASRWSQSNVDDNGYQTTRAEVGMATGRFFGVGLGNGWVKHKIPAPTTDFVMATVAEETGLLGSTLVLAFIGALVMRLMWLARSTVDRYGKLCLSGIAIWIGIQTCVNLMMANATLPAIGIPVPFISSGGSSLLALWIALAVAQSIVAPPIRKETKQNATGPKWWWHRRSRLSRA